MPEPSPSLTLRVQNLEQNHASLVKRVDEWDAKWGKLLSVSGESRDAAVRAADQVLELIGQIRDLKISIDTRCDERCGSIRQDMKDIKKMAQDKPAPRDEFDITTDLMDRDQLMNSREFMKAELAAMKEQLEELSQAEEKRQQAERDKLIAQRAVANAEVARQKAEADAKAARDAAQADSLAQAATFATQLKREKLKSITSITLAVLGILGAIVTAIVTHYFG